jgi:hypothetical protein
MAIARIAVLQQVDPALAFECAPVHLDQCRHGYRFAPADNACCLDRPRKRARKECRALKLLGQPELRKMSTRLIV